MRLSVRAWFSTVNSAEMTTFGKFRNWWHPNSEMHILYQYNYQRIAFISSVFNRSFSGVNVLDVGCGAGFLTTSLARLGATAVGIDPNSTSYSQAVAHYQKLKEELPHLSFQNMTVEHYLEQNPAAQFSLVTSMDVIEHVDKPHIFVETLAKVLLPDGILVVSTIAKKFQTWLTHIVLAEHVSGLVPVGTHHYDKFINPNDLETLFKMYGIQVIAKKHYDLNWRGQFEEKQGGGNYILIGKKIPVKQVTMID